MNPRNSTANIATTNLISKALGTPAEHLDHGRVLQKLCRHLDFSANIRTSSFASFCLCFNPI